MFKYCRVADGADWHLPEFHSQRQRRPQFSLPGRNNWAFLLIDKCFNDLCTERGSAIGLGVGTEPLPIFAVEYGFERVVATEYEPAGWGASLQKMADAYAHYPQIEVRHENMLATPQSVERFDLIWSNCSPEHVGTDEQIFDMMVGLYEKNLNENGVMVMVIEYRLFGPTAMEPGICFSGSQWLRRLVERIPVVSPVKTSFSRNVFNNTTPLWARGPRRLATTLFLLEHPNGFLSSSICLVWKKGAQGYSDVELPDPAVLRDCVRRGREIQEWADTRNYDQLPPEDVMVRDTAPGADAEPYIAFVERVLRRRPNAVVGILGNSPLSDTLMRALPERLQTAVMRLVPDGMTREGVLNEQARERVVRDIRAVGADCWILGRQSQYAFRNQYALVMQALSDAGDVPVFFSKSTWESNELVRLSDDPPTPSHKRFLDAPAPIFEKMANAALEDAVGKVAGLMGDVLLVGYTKRSVVELIRRTARTGKRAPTLYHVVMNSVCPPQKMVMVRRMMLEGVAVNDDPFLPQGEAVAETSFNDLVCRLAGKKLSLVYVRQNLTKAEVLLLLDLVDAHLPAGGHVFFDCTAAAGGPVVDIVLDQVLPWRDGYYMYRTGVHQRVAVKMTKGFAPPGGLARTLGAARAAGRGIWSGRFLAQWQRRRGNQ